jgi:site-specific recombinase XerD
MTTTITSNALLQRLAEDLAARKRGPASLKQHLRAYHRFAAWLGRSPETTTAEEVRNFQHHLADQKLSISTRNATMSGLRFLFRVTMRRHDLAAEIFHLKEPQKVPLTLDQAEVRRLLLMAAKPRDRMLLSLGYGTGMRAGEVLRLRVKHIDSEQGIIRVEQGKGKKDRHVMLSRDMLAQLREWWKVRPKHWDAGVPAEERLLFPGRYGKPIAVHSFNTIFHIAAKAAAIRKAVNLHTLRHSFATHLYDRGVDIRTIQALLGHDKLETTARYARVATGLISAVQSPLDLLDAPRTPRRKAKKETPDT